MSLPLPYRTPPERRLQFRTAWVTVLVVGLVTLILVAIQVPGDKKEAPAPVEPALSRGGKLDRCLVNMPGFLMPLPTPFLYQSRDDCYALAFAELEKKLSLPPGSLEKDLPAHARRRLEDSRSHNHLLACALLTLRDYSAAETVSITARNDSLAPDPPDVEGACVALMTAGCAAQLLDAWDRAAVYYEEALRYADPEQQGSIGIRLGFSLYTAGKYPAAEAAWRRLSEWLEARPEINREARHVLHFCQASTLEMQGREQEALTAYERTLAEARRTLDESHPVVAATDHAIDKLRASLLPAPAAEPPAK